MKLIIAGGRKMKDTKTFALGMVCFLNAFKLKSTDIKEIVSGGASGADKMGEGFAKMTKIPVKLFPAEWNRFGKGAGPIRNEQMAQYGTHLLLFWDGESTGSKDMLERAIKHGLKIFVFRYDNPSLSEVIDPAPLFSV